MDESAFLQLVENASLLLALAFLFDVTALRWRISRFSLQRAIIGLLIGAIGVGVMLLPWTFTAGIVFDTRSVLLSISGLFFGAAPTVVAMAITAGFRLFQGGGGAWPGVSVILATGILGIVWRHYRRRPLADMTCLELYAFGVVTHLVMLALMLMLPRDIALRVLAAIGLPVLALYPVATVLLGLLMVNRLRRVQTEETLRENERRFRSYLDNAPYGVFVVDSRGAHLEVNPAACRITGYSEAELLAMRIPDLFMPESAAAGARYFRQAMQEGQAHGETTFRRKDGALGWWAVAAIRLSDTRLLGFAEDITTRKEAEAQAKAAQAEQARLLVEAEQTGRALLSVVEDQKRTEAALQRRNDFLAALQETTIELVSQLNLDALLENVVKRAGQLAGTTSGFLDLLDSETGQLVPRVGIGVLTESLQYRVRPGEGVAGVVWQTGRPLVVNDYDRWPDRISGFSRDTLRAIIGVPLLAGSQVVGVLGLAHAATSEQSFDQDAVEIMTQFARLAMIAIENARSFTAADRSRRALLSVIEDQKRAEDEIRALNAALEQHVRDRTAQLQAANQELEAFAYSVSHDLRAPLRALDGFSAALLAGHSDRLEPEGRHYLDRILQASQRMGQLINDLLNLSRVTRAEFTRQPVDLAVLAREIAAELSQRDPQRRVELVIAERLETAGDPRLLRIALQNLLENAWKFTGPRSFARIEVGRIVDSRLPIADVDTAPTSKSANRESQIENPRSQTFFVRDNGVGFDMTYANKLFAPFQRLHALDEFPGTGIGLVTVQRIITRHGGRVWTEAEVDKGATFYFTI